MNEDPACRWQDGMAAARILIQGLAFVFDSRVNGRTLHNLAAKSDQGIANILLGQIVGVGASGNLTFAVAGIRSNAEYPLRFIFFDGTKEHVRQFCIAAEKDGQHPFCKRIQTAAVSRFGPRLGTRFGTELALSEQSLNHTECPIGGNARGLIQQQNAVGYRGVRFYGCLHMTGLGIGSSNFPELGSEDVAHRTLLPACGRNEIQGWGGT